ncbi:MAG: hypothetical protein HVN35_08730 [Methanobacteriaceae archaeon]|nr:hypothetical protein [Methanobacteriaceae archaeon]
MRASQGVPSGRKVMLYHPELFCEYEEVIIYPQREFKRNFMTIKDHVNYSFLMDCQFGIREEWQIMGYWLAILERVNMIEIGMNQFFSARESQSCLDSYLYAEFSDETINLDGEISESLIQVHTKPLSFDWF